MTIPEDLPTYAIGRDPGDLMDEMRDELTDNLQRMLWKKGDVEIIPYAMGRAYANWSTDTVFADELALWAVSEEDQNGAEFNISARRSRIGLKGRGVDVCTWWGKAEVGGLVEGSFLVLSSPRNSSWFRLRHGYGEVKNKRFRFLMGQTWDVISPLRPYMIGPSALETSGNMGNRRPQIRFERYFERSSTFLVATQFALSTDSNTDFFADCPLVAVDANWTAEGERLGWPVLQGRTELVFGRHEDGDDPWTFGVSAHLGEIEYAVSYEDGATTHTFNQSIVTWSLGIDARAPITSKFGVQGELFLGQNLAELRGGVAQGVGLFENGADSRLHGVYARGGWLEFWYAPWEKWQFFSGYGIDDPSDAWIEYGGRTYNQTIYATTTYRVTEQLLLGFEVDQFRTGYMQKSRGEAANFIFMTAFVF